MNKRQWKKLGFFCLVLTLLINLPFLPGPKFLNGAAQLFIIIGQILGLFAVLAVPIGLIIIASLYRKNIRNSQLKLHAITYTVIAGVIFLSSFFVSNGTRYLSRQLAIYNAKKIITAIEKDKLKNGHYPANINAISSKPWPIGIEKYQYKITNGSYTLSFLQFVNILNFEVVTYDPLDTHQADGELITLYETGHKHWKYYIYD